MKERIEKRRLYNIDLLKIICCISVIIIHITAPYINKIKGNELVFLNLFNCITRFAIPSFVMISGYFAISNINKYSTEEYYKKKIKNILVPTIVFSIFYSIISLVGQIIEYFDKGTSIK